MDTECRDDACQTDGQQNPETTDNHESADTGQPPIVRDSNPPAPRRDSLPPRLLSDHSVGRIFSFCETGANHRDRQLPCQDACLGAVQHYRGQPFAVLAVADGHGSDKYTRSEIGAHLAVQAALISANRFLLYAMDLFENPEYKSSWFINAKDEFNARFGKWLVEDWRESVKRHLKTHSIEGLSEDSDDGLIHYGTTIAVAVLFEKQVFAGGIGDSSIFSVKGDNTEDNPNSLKTIQLIGSETDTFGLRTPSLCSRDAHQQWQSVSIPQDEIRMILLCTDGLTDSLENPEKTITSICRHSKVRGDDWLATELSNALGRFSRDGVGDDIASIVFLPADDSKTAEVQSVEK